MSPMTARTKNPRIFLVKQHHYTKAAHRNNQKYFPKTLCRFDADPNQCMDWSDPNLEPREKRKCKGETRSKTYLPAMEGTCGNFGTTRKQLEHVFGLEDGTGGDDMGDSDVVEEKKERI